MVGAAAAKKQAMTMMEDRRDLGSMSSALMMPTAMAPEDDRAGEPGGQQQAEDDAADGEPDEHPGERAAREEHTAQGHALGETGLFHGFTEDGRAEGGPDEHGGPRSEHDFGRGHVGQQVEEGQRGGDSHGGQEIEGPDDDRCGGHPEIEGHLRRNVTGSQQVEQAGEAEHGEPL